MSMMFTTCNNCDDIVTYVDTDTDFDRSYEPVWDFMGVPCCSSSVNPCQTIRLGNPRSYDSSSEYSAFLQYVGRLMSVYGYDIDNHIAEVWSNMPNSIQYEDLVMYYNWMVVYQ